MFIIILANYMITYIELDSKVCRVYSQNCQFLESEGKVDLEIKKFSSKFVVQ